MSTHSHKIVLIGDSSVGKTSIINQFIYGSVDSEHQPTVAIDFFAKAMKIDNQTIRLQIWDTAGQEKFKSLIPSYIRTSTVAVLVYDITSKASFNNLDMWYKLVIDLANPKIFVVGNKIDLEDQRAVTAEEGKKFADQYQAEFFETSARAPTNITELFNTIARVKIEPPNEVKHLEAAPPKAIDGKELADKTNANNQSNSGSCC